MMTSRLWLGVVVLACSLVPNAAHAFQTPIPAGAVSAPQVRQPVATATPRPVQIPTRWSNAIKVSAGTSGGWFPTLAAEGDDTVHIIWNGQFPADNGSQPAASDSGRSRDPREVDPNGLTALFYVRGNGQDWTQPADIGLAWTGYAIRSALAIDGSGRLHLIRRGIGSNEPKKRMEDRLWYASAPGDQAETVQAWSDPTEVTRELLGYYSDLAIDSQGVIHCVWTEGIGDSGWGIWYMRSSDGGATWSDRVPLDDGDFVWWYRAHMVIDPLDRIHVTWENADPDRFGPTVAANYAMSADGGTTWAKTRFDAGQNSGATFGGTRPTPQLPAGVDILGARPGPQQPAVGVDGHGTILLVSREPRADRIVFQQSLDGRAWSTPTALPGVISGVARPYDIYDMVSDSLGHVHLAFVGVPVGATRPYLLHSEWTGAAWQAPEVINSLPNPEYPKLAISGGNRLHVTWFTGTKLTIDRDPQDVWYSSVQLAAPRQSRRVVVVPTATPNPATTRGKDTETPFPKVRSTPTLPDVNSSTSQPATSATAELRSWNLFPVFAAVLPVAALLVFVVAAKLGVFRIQLRRRAPSSSASRAEPRR